MITGRLYDEASVLRVALAYERATKWHTMNPPLDENLKKMKTTAAAVGRVGGGAGWVGWTRWVRLVASWSAFHQGQPLLIRTTRTCMQRQRPLPVPQQDATASPNMSLFFRLL